MPLVLVISSYVAASRVGGGIAPYVLGPMKVDPVHVPTCLFGRHPGWGPPGGAAVAADTMTKMLEGVQANGLFGLMDAVVTGYFSAPAQVAVACDAIDRIRATPRGRVAPRISRTSRSSSSIRSWATKRPASTSSPKPQAALMADLAPRADILAPNLWEFAKAHRHRSRIASLRRKTSHARSAAAGEAAG
jgi:pyridoxine kinase